MPLPPPSDGDPFPKPGDPASEAIRAHCRDYLSEYGHVDVDILGLGDPSYRLPRTAYLPRTFQAMREFRDSELRRMRDPPGADSAPGRQSRAEERTLREERLIAALRGPRARVLVTGDGGNGKTEFTRHAAHALADRALDAAETAPCVPVRIELKNLVLAKEAGRDEDPGEPLIARLRKGSGPLAKRFGDTPLFDALAERGRVALILDGLDELRADSRDRFLRMLPALFRGGGRLAACPLLLAGRSSALATEITSLVDQAWSLHPCPLKRDAIESHIRAWFDPKRNSALDAARGAALIRAVRAARGALRDLLGWPLMLALACLRWERGIASLADSPAEFMVEGLTELLERRRPQGGGLTTEQALHALSQLALAACPAFEALPAARANAAAGSQAVQALAERSGLFFGNAARGYSFTIRPLAEYLAGRALAAEDGPASETFAERAWDDRWAAPLGWMVGELWRSPARGGLADRLVAALFDQPDDVAGTMRRRGLALLSHSRPPLDPRLSQLFQRLSQSMSSDDIERHRETFRAMPPFAAAIFSGPWRDRLDPAKEPEGEVRSAAALALGSIGDARAVERLLDCLDPAKEPEGEVRSAAVRALRSIGDARAVGPLLDRLDPAKEPDESVRWAAAVALWSIDDARAVGPLLDRLDPKNESHRSVRSAAARALRSIGDARAVPALIEHGFERDAAGLLARHAKRLFQLTNEAVEKLSRRYPSATRIHRLPDPEASTPQGDGGDYFAIVPIQELRVDIAPERPPGGSDRPAPAREAESPERLLLQLAALAGKSGTHETLRAALVNADDYLSQLSERKGVSAKQAAQVWLCVMLRIAFGEHPGAGRAGLVKALGRHADALRGVAADLHIPEETRAAIHTELGEIASESAAQDRLSGFAGNFCKSLERYCQALFAPDGGRLPVDIKSHLFELNLRQKK